MSSLCVLAGRLLEGVNGLVDAVGGVEVARPGVVGQNVGALVVAAAVAGQEDDHGLGGAVGDRSPTGSFDLPRRPGPSLRRSCPFASERLVVVVLGPLLQAVESVAAERRWTARRGPVVGGADQHEAERVGRPQPEVDRPRRRPPREEQRQREGDLHAARHARPRPRPCGRPSRRAGRPTGGRRRCVRLARTVSAAAGCCWAWRSRWKKGKGTGRRLDLVCTSGPGRVRKGRRVGRPVLKHG